MATIRMFGRLPLTGLRHQQLFARSSTILTGQTGIRHSSSHPSIADASFWKSLVPKPLRKENRIGVKKKKSKEWNPATFYIVIFLFIGSMSIQMIALRNQTDRYMRQSTVRIALLREIVEKIQNGEDVDVEKLLGTGDAQKEADWEEMLKEIERQEASDKASSNTILPNSPATASTKNYTPSTPASNAPVEEPPAERPKPKAANFGNFF